MAFSFNGSTQYLNTTSTPVTAKPVTTFARVWRTTTTGGATVSAVGYVGNISGSNRVQVAADVPTDAYYAVEVGTSVVSTTTVTMPGAQVWFGAAGVFTSATSRSVYVDTTSQSSTTSSGTAATWDGIAFGARASSNSWAYFHDGRLADIAVWDVALTDDEIKSLSKGFKPYRIRPQNLRFYAPLIRNLQDIRGALAITNNNTATVTDHPRVY